MLAETKPIGRHPPTHRDAEPANAGDDGRPWPGGRSKHSSGLVERQLGLDGHQLQLMLSKVKLRVLGDASSERATIGRFEIVRKLGAGAMGIVYLARDPELERQVALKCIHPSLFGSRALPKLRARMQREAKAMARLTHANVVAIHEVGAHDDQLFIAMEFIDGATLSDWIETHEPSWEQILAAFIRAGEGLAHAHAVGLVHRDFKPDNVLLSDDGQVKVSDFGLAGLRGPVSELDTPDPDAQPGDAGMALTRTGTILGTPAYMSPEQFEGLDADARSDQFSFCVALHEALFRSRPFPGDSYDALSSSVCGGERVEPQHNPGVPRWVRAIIERGLSRRPQDRWPSMRALLDALSSDPRPRRRRIAAAAMFAACVLALALGVATNAVSRAHQVAACEAEAAAAPIPWTEARRAQLELAIDAHGSPELSRHYRHEVFASLDQVNDSIRSARRDLCVMAEVERSVSPAAADRLATCIATTERWTSAVLDAALDGSAPAAWLHASQVDRRPRIAHCFEIEQHFGGQGPQPTGGDPHPGADSRLRTIVTSMHEADGLLVGGRPIEAAALAEHMLALSRALDWGIMVAHAHLLRGRALAASGDPQAAGAELENAYIVARRHAFKPMLAESAALLARLEDEHGQLMDGRGVWLRLAEATLTDAGPLGPWERELIELARATHLREHGEFAAALAVLDDIVEHMSHGPDRVTLFVVLRERARTQLAAGDLEAAQATLEHALADSSARYGDTGPDRWWLLSELADVHERAGELVRARQRHREAVAVARALTGSDSVATRDITDAAAALERRHGHDPRID